MGFLLRTWCIALKTQSYIKLIARWEAKIWRHLWYLQHAEAQSTTTSGVYCCPHHTAILQVSQFQSLSPQDSSSSITLTVHPIYFSPCADLIYIEKYKTKSSYLMSLYSFALLSAWSTSSKFIYAYASLHMQKAALMKAQECQTEFKSLLTPIGALHIGFN